MTPLSLQSQHEQKTIDPFFIDFSSSLFLSGHLNWFQVINKAKINTKNIKQIGFSHCEMKDEDIDLLLTFNWGCMNRLDLSCNYVTPRGLSKLMNGICINRLSKLDLSSNFSIRVNGIKLLSKIQFPCLKILCLNQCFALNQGTKHISKLYCPNLQIFYFSKNLVKLDGIYFLLKTFCLEIKDIKLWSSFQQYQTNLNNADDEVQQAISSMSLIIFKGNDLKIWGGCGSILNRDLRFTIQEIYENSLRLQERQ